MANYTNLDSLGRALDKLEYWVDPEIEDAVAKIRTRYETVLCSAFGELRNLLTQGQIRVCMKNMPSNDDEPGEFSVTFCDGRVFIASVDDEEPFITIPTKAPDPAFLRIPHILSNLSRLDFIKYFEKVGWEQ